MTTPKQLEYHVVDVFTDRAFAGNPLAVVLGAEGLSTGQMQQLAREFHLSETAFPLFGDDAAESAGADYRLRIFTPDVEIPFAGHPSVGTAWLMAQLGRAQPRDGRLWQLCAEGLLPVDVATSQATLTGGTATVGEALAAQPLLGCVGLADGDLFDPLAWPGRVCSTGLGFAVFRVRSGALDRCAPDLGALQRHLRYPSDATGIYLVSFEAVLDENAIAVDARMFAGDVGVPEDAATGSAALALGVYCVEGGLLPRGGTLSVTQGVAMGRRSQLHVAVDADDGTVTSAKVTGGVVPVASGRIRVPD